MNDEYRDEDFEMQEERGDERGPWLVTFADLTLLLLVFFVLLFTMSSVDRYRFKESFLSVRQALGVEGPKEGYLSVKIESGSEGVLVSEIQARRQLIQSQKNVFSDLNYFYTDKGLEGKLGANLESGIITIRAPGDLLFELGEVELSTEGKEVIKNLKDFFIRHKDQIINIRGHTDDIPPREGGKFDDNWEISSMRAVNVLRYLLDLGMEPKRLTATGLADLNPLFPNNSPENRARNRRVEFVLEKRIGGGL